MRDEDVEEPMDADQRGGSGDDDTSPEVQVQGGRVATDTGPRPAEGDLDVVDHGDEVQVIDDPDATGAIPTGDGPASSPEDAPARLPLEGPAPPAPRRRPARPEPGDDLDAWSSFATSGPRWRDQRPATSADDETSITPEPSAGTSRRGRRPTADREREQRRPQPAAAGDTDREHAADEVVPDAELGIPARLGRRWRRRQGGEAAGGRPERARPGVAAGASIGARRRDAEEDRDAPSRSGTRPGADETGPDATGDPVLQPASRIVRGRPRPQEPDPAEARPRTAADRDLPRAIAIGVGFAAAALLAFAIGPAMAVAFVTVVVAVAGAELFGGLQRSGFQPATLLGLVATAALPLAAYWRGEPALPLVLALTIIATFLWYLTGVSRVSPTLNTAVTVLAVGYVGLLGAFAALLLAFPNGTGALIGVILVVVANDTGALLVGRRVGRRLLAPEVSPRKTWEGVAGGAAASVVVSVVVLGIIGLAPWDFGSALALGLVVAVVTPLGDLCESMVKRDLGVKDMGAVLPGHGGLLDRFDGLLFALPAAYYLCRLLDVF